MAVYPIKITSAQARLLPMIRQGLRYAAIAKQTGLSIKTIKNHVYAMAQQMDTDNDIPPYRRVQLWALQNNLSP